MHSNNKLKKPHLLTNHARHSVRGVAVGLSFLLAACTTPGIKTPVETAQEPDRLPTTSEKAPEKAAEKVPEKVEPVTLSVSAVGDIMLGTDYPHNRLPSEEMRLLKEVSATLQQADIAFGNLEGVLQDGGEPVKQCSNPSRCYLFRTPTRFVQQLREAGFDAMNLANNHARDFGEKGRSNSMATLAGAGLHHTGRDGDIASWEVKGRKVALIGYSPFGGSNNMHAHQQMKQQIEALSRDHDIVLVTFHGGGEGADATRIPFKEEFFYGENRGDVVVFAHHAIDAGADLVIGHGPHVPRAVELYRDRLIAYSLGNFATYYGINVRGNNGLAPILTAVLDEDGRFISGQIDSFRQIRPSGPQYDDKHRSARLISELTKADFPDTPLKIDERGSISVTSPSALSGAPPQPEPDNDDSNG